MSADDFRTRPIGDPGDNYTGPLASVVSATFADEQSAHAAITELRQMGIPARNISIISRNASPQDAGDAGVASENIGEQDLTYTTSEELPNDEDLPTTTADMTGKSEHVFLDYEVPPDDPLGGARQLGLVSEQDSIHRADASTNADVDIYADFPSEPGGVNPDSPAAPGASEAATEQLPVELGEERVGSAVVGAGLGGIAGLLVGIAALAVPGIGPILAAGPIAAALGGMLAGGAAGGIIGALATEGVPEEYARRYAASIQQGRTLVSVRTDTLGIDAIERVLVAHGGTEVH